jgi:hypothetical protein
MRLQRSDCNVKGGEFVVTVTSSERSDRKPLSSRVRKRVLIPGQFVGAVGAQILLFVALRRAVSCELAKAGRQMTIPGSRCAAFPVPGGKRRDKQPLSRLTWDCAGVSYPVQYRMPKFFFFDTVLQTTTQ